jgi:2-keto-4-pentenoate hydratase/2-oxohepta-3-ene-1,7-dioic acid hydratase in catechol pathway
MKLITFTLAGATRIGCVAGDQIIDFATAAPELPREMIALLEAGPDALAASRRAEHSTVARVPLAQARLEAPILRPPKFLAIGLNYADHIAEARPAGYQATDAPIFFNKQSTCVIGPGAPIHLPRVSHRLDYEGELAFVIGRRCRHVPRERAHEVVAGFTICNDVSVRDWQRRTPTMTMGKSFDTHGPLGPWLVTPDEVGDPHALGIRTFVNDELRQDSNTRHLIHDCWAQIEHLSTAFTLEVGDVISTGTPAGVGGAMKPPKWLVAGDRVRIEIDRIGTLENPVIDEPADTARIT